MIKLSILPTGEVEQALLVTSSERNVLDEAAFQAHLASDHYKAFAGAIEGLEAARRICQFRLSNP